MKRRITLTLTFSFLMVFGAGMEVSSADPLPGTLVVVGPEAPAQSSSIGSAPSSAGGYGWAFWISPTGTVSGWTSLLHRGASNTARSPSVYFYPNSTRLHVRTSSSSTWNDGSDPVPSLPIEEWTHVVIDYAGTELRIFFDGVPVVSETLGTVVTDDGKPLYFSNPWADSAPALVSGLRYFAGGDMTQDTIDELVAAGPEGALVMELGSWGRIKVLYQD